MTSSRRLPVHLSPRPIRSLGRLLADADIALRTAHGTWPYLAAAVLALAFLVGVLSGDYRLDWDGLHHISPADLAHPAPSCGDYCGTDALPPRV